MTNPRADFCEVLEAWGSGGWLARRRSDVCGDPAGEERLPQLGLVLGLVC
ncbi:hypothetical protein V6Z11_A01G124600 [Gossypium hirsutum]